jgi:hypothetical protein
MLFVDVTAAGHEVLDVRARLAAEGVLVTMVAGKIRMLTHVDIGDGDVDAAIGAWRRVVDELPAVAQEG